MPTGINADHMHFAMLRLDYCLVSAALLEGSGAGAGSGAAAACRAADGGGKGGAGALSSALSRRRGASAKLLRDERTNSLSDHFPLEVEFDSEG